MTTRSSERGLVPLAVVIAFTLFQVRLLWDFHQSWFEASHRTTFQILNGHPYIRAFQNRLLGPAIIEGFHAAGLSLHNSVYLFNYVFYAVQNVAMLYILRRLLAHRGDALRETLMFMGIYTFLMHHLSYPWDILELITFTVLMFLILEDLPLWAYALLALVGTVNKESSVLIGVWLVLDSFRYSGSLRLTSKARALTGAAIVLAGIGYTRWVRDLMFISSWSEAIGLDQKHTWLGGNHVELVENIRKVLALGLSPETFVTRFFTLFILGFYAYSLRRLDDLTIKLSILGLLMLATIMFAGITSETRVFLGLVPIMYFTHLHTEKMLRTRGERNGRALALEARGEPVPAAKASQ